MSENAAAISGYLTALQDALVRWGPLLTFGALFIECIPVLGIIVPGLTLLVVAGFVAASQGCDYTAVTLLAALTGVAAADTLTYLIGRTGAARISVVRRFIARHDGLRRELASERFLVLCLYQFPPYSRMFGPLLLGAVALPWRRWCVIVSIGTVAFVGSFFGLGFAAGVAGRALFGAVNAASMVSALFLGALLLWLIAFVAGLRRRVRRLQDT